MMTLDLPPHIETAMHRLFVQIQQDSRVLIFVKDQNSNILFGNPAFLKLFPPDDRDKIIGIADATRFNESEAKVFSDEDKKAFETGYAEIIERITDYAGRVHTLHTRKTRFCDDKGAPMILGMSMDISSLAEKERALAQSNLALENFAAVAAHDLRSPLAALQTSLDVIQNDTHTHLGPRAKKYISLMQGSIDGLMEQISNLLKACKIHGSESLTFEDCDISILFEEVRYNLSHLIDASRARVLSTHLPRLKVNKSMFRQLLHNLIENSIKYRRDDVPIIILRYEEGAHTHHFALEDNGIGISPSDAKRIFDTGMQVDGQSDGYGLGLALCRKIIEAHKGKIYADTDYDRGSRICFELPVQAKCER